MATRPVFITYQDSPHFREIPTEFIYYSGFAEIQRRRSAESLREAFERTHPTAKVLEVSRFSDNVLGQRLSAFNLIATLKSGKKVPVENAFQASKCFELGGPYTDLLDCKPVEAKKDPRIKESGMLIGFELEGEKFPLEPKTFFYDWLYINALKDNDEVTRQLLQYNSFTDIVFNPEKSINCQARTIAIYVSLCKTGQIDMAMKSRDDFEEIVYGSRTENHKESQYSLFN
ncbi:MAG: hypothetical protein K5771_08865 [Oscillospiraceae bacterium]|nr:hypothetical protein [Oscillospiraceae bacterium]